MNKIMNYESGYRINNVEVIKETEKVKHKRMFLCKCLECNNVFITRMQQLNPNYIYAIHSCLKCARKKAIKKAAETTITHHKSNTKLYNVWNSMKQRCCNKKTLSYKNYGGRGIKVYEEWYKDFETFYKWSIANGYKEGLTLDRIDVNGNYEPANCRWVSMKEQQNNRRDNLIYNGKHISEISKETGIKEKTLYERIRKEPNISYEELIKPTSTQICIEGVTLKNISKISGIDYKTIWYRYNQNHNISYNEIIKK